MSILSRVSRQRRAAVVATLLLAAGAGCARNNPTAEAPPPAAAAESPLPPDGEDAFLKVPGPLTSDMEFGPGGDARYDPAAEEAAAAKLEADIVAHLPSEADLAPPPPVVIPDNPPPHEGAMFSYPLTVQPPDILVIEVLEAFPGRPITGERLVRPDGTISLDFYGDVQVRGLTLAQIKQKIIVHLRDFLSDEVLGLVEYDMETAEPHAISPAQSDRIFVDFASYNHMFYNVVGDLYEPSRFPFTGQDTVIDAIAYAGGLTPTADRSNIRLHRPGDGPGKTKVFEIDLDAIDQGDPAANLQVFPGDRIVVGRSPAVRTTLALDRLHEASAPQFQQINDVARAVKSALDALGELPASKSDRAALVDQWVDTAWLKPDGEPPTHQVDRETFRRLLRLSAGLPGAGE